MVSNLHCGFVKQSHAAPRLPRAIHVSCREYVIPPPMTRSIGSSGQENSASRKVPSVIRLPHYGSPRQLSSPSESAQLQSTQHIGLVSQ